MHKFQQCINLNTTAVNQYCCFCQIIKFSLLKTFLDNAIKRYGEYVTNSHYWLGMDDLEVEGYWKWIDGVDIDPKIVLV